MARWLTVDQYAAEVQVPPDLVREWCRTGQVRARKFGRYWRIRAEEVEWKEGDGRCA